MTVLQRYRREDINQVSVLSRVDELLVADDIGAHIKEPYRIITRFCQGKSLFDRIHRAPKHTLSPAKLTSLAYQVASGMAFLYSNGIVHRDLKTMNILLRPLRQNEGQQRLVRHIGHPPTILRLRSFRGGATVQRSTRTRTGTRTASCCGRWRPVSSPSATKRTKRS